MKWLGVLLKSFSRTRRRCWRNTTILELEPLSSFSLSRHIPSSNSLPPPSLWNRSLVPFARTRRKTYQPCVRYWEIQKVYQNPRSEESQNCWNQPKIPRRNLWDRWQFSSTYFKKTCLWVGWQGLIINNFAQLEKEIEAGEKEKSRLQSIVENQEISASDVEKMMFHKEKLESS